MTCNSTDISKKSWHKLMVLIIVVLALICIMLSAKPVYAAEIVASGECGANGSIVTWTLDDEGVLTISGEGEMADFSDNTTIYFKPYINDIKTIIIENGVTNIGDWAFSSCINLTNIKIPNSVASIGIAAFKGCSSLTGINVPNSVLSIKDSAFSRCDNLMKLLIPESVRSIGKNIFYRTEQVDVYVVKNSYADTWLQDNGYSEKIKYLYKSGEHYYYEQITKLPTCTENGSKTITCVICGEEIEEQIPASHNLIKVDAKEASEFEDGNIEYWYCSECGKYFADETCEQEIPIDSITIPKTDPVYTEISWILNDDGVLTVSGEGRMQDYEKATDTPWYSERANVKKIIVSDGLTTIGSRAFYQCTNATDVEIASTVKTIGAWAFYSNTLLAEAIIPAGVISLGDSSFRLCSALTRVQFEGNAPAVGNYVFTSVSSELEIHCYENSTGWDAEAWTGYNVIADHKYGEFTVVKEATCTETGEKQGLCEICGEIITEEIPALGHDWSEWVVTKAVTCTEAGEEKRVCGRCGEEETGEIPVLGHEYVDGYCSRCGEREVLASGKCGENVNYILYGDGEMVISGNGDITSNSSYSYVKDKIKTVRIEEGVTSIGNGAFRGCRSLTSIEIPEGVTSLGENAFDSCSSLTSITIPEGITNIENNTFYGCHSLTSIEMPESITSIGNGAFRGCRSLTSMEIPEGVTSLGENAFGGCSSLTNITIPDSVTSMDVGVFRDCSLLKNVTISNGVTTIVNEAFANCSSLTSIIIPEGVASIGDNAFLCCSNLTSIMIPDSVTSIGRSAFEGCNSLTSITIPNSVTEIQAFAFYECESLKIIKVPFIGGSKTDNTYLGYLFGSSDSYDSHLDVPASLKEVIITGNITEISSNAFSECRSLTSITLPEVATSIGDGAFRGCNSLTNIMIPEGVTSIGDEAFERCWKLKNITLPKGLTAIGNCVFNECASLTRVTIPNKVTIIGNGAFCKCTELISINIPGGVTNVGHTAFSNCSKLTSITIPDSVISIGVNAFDACDMLNYIYVVKDSYADTWLKDNGYSEKIKYVYKSGEHYYYETVTEPTCEEAGSKRLLCVVCGETTYEQIPATGHTPGDIVRENEVFATCIEAGSYDEVVYCQTCNKELSRNKKAVPALGHNMIHHGAKEPTCEEIGWDAYDTCSRCDYTTYVEIPATGHTPVTDPAVAPTCEGTGLTEGNHCSVCGKVIVEQETIAALGHDWGEWVVIKEATTTEEGLERRTCLRDESHYEDRVIPKKIPEKTSWVKEDGYWYFYEQDGTMAVSTWKKDSKGWCYLAEDGRMVTNGWAKDTKGWVYVGSDGYMVTGTKWIKYDGGWYHITNGYRDQSKWMKDSQGWCWLQEDGRMLTNGWAKDSKGWCWIAANGYMPTTTQWIKYDGSWYHITKGYRDQSKWMKDSQGWCWLQADGRMLTNGWAKDSKGWCWIAANGYMPTTTQWVKYDGGWYHITKGYRDENKWMKDSKGWCWLQADGRMLTNGWAKDTKGWCWIGEAGYMIEEDMWIGEPGAVGSSYIIKGYRVDDQTIEIEGVEYTFDKDGKLVG